jgi:hypothetical protein
MNPKSVDCDQRGPTVEVGGRTYTAYACTVHRIDGRVDDALGPYYWDQHRLLNLNQLPRAAANRLFMD